MSTVRSEPPTFHREKLEYSCQSVGSIEVSLPEDDWLGCRSSRRGMRRVELRVWAIGIMAAAVDIAQSTTTAHEASIGQQQDRRVVVTRQRRCCHKLEGRGFGIPDLGLQQTLVTAEIFCVSLAAREEDLTVHTRMASVSAGRQLN